MRKNAAASRYVDSERVAHPSSRAVGSLVDLCVGEFDKSDGLAALPLRKWADSAAIFARLSSELSSPWPQRLLFLPDPRPQIDWSMVTRCYHLIHASESNLRNLSTFFFVSDETD